MVLSAKEIRPKKLEIAVGLNLSQRRSCSDIRLPVLLKRSSW